MDSKTIDRAMKHRLPVVYDGRRYDYIREYVSWYDNNGRRQLSVGIVTNNCMIRVPVDKVELAQTKGVSSC